MFIVAGPAVIVEGVEGEGDVGAGEDDEVEVAEEKKDFGCYTAEAEAGWHCQLSALGMKSG